MLNKLKKLSKKIKLKNNKKRYSLAIIFQKINNIDYLIMQKRSANLKRQPCEICFTGGSIDKGETAKDAIYREIEEELNIDIKKLKYAGKLTKYNSHFLNVFHVFLFTYTDKNRIINYNRDEVDSLLYIPIKELISCKEETHIVNLKYEFKDNFPFKKIPHNKDYPFINSNVNIYFYTLQNTVVWGLSAYILNIFLREYKKTF